MPVQDEGKEPVDRIFRQQMLGLAGWLENVPDIRRFHTGAAFLHQFLCMFLPCHAGEIRKTRTILAIIARAGLVRGVG